MSAMDYDRQVGLLGHRFNVLFGLIYDSFVCHTMSRELDNAAYKRRITVLSTWGIIAARAITYQAKRDFNVARKLHMALEPLPLQEKPPEHHLAVLHEVGIPDVPDVPTKMKASSQMTPYKGGINLYWKYCIARDRANGVLKQYGKATSKPYWAFVRAEYDAPDFDRSIWEDRVKEIRDEAAVDRQLLLTHRAPLEICDGSRSALAHTHQGCLVPLALADFSVLAVIDSPNPALDVVSDQLVAVDLHQACDTKKVECQIVEAGLFISGHDAASLQSSTEEMQPLSNETYVTMRDIGLKQLTDVDSKDSLLERHSRAFATSVGRIARAKGTIPKTVHYERRCRGVCQARSVRSVWQCFRSLGTILKKLCDEHNRVSKLYHHKLLLAVIVWRHVRISQRVVVLADCNLGAGFADIGPHATQAFIVLQPTDDHIYDDTHTSDWFRAKRFRLLREPFVEPKAFGKMWKRWTRSVVLGRVRCRLAYDVAGDVLQPWNKPVERSCVDVLAFHWTNWDELHVTGTTRTLDSAAIGCGNDSDSGDDIDGEMAFGGRRQNEEDLSGTVAEVEQITPVAVPAHLHNIGQCLPDEDVVDDSSTSSDGGGGEEPPVYPVPPVGGPIAAMPSSSSGPMVPVPSPLPDPVPLPPDSDIAIRQVRRQRWSLWSISPVFSHGVHVGWGGNCGKHFNTALGERTRCQSSITAGKYLTLDECRVRMKLWLLAGLAVSDDDLLARQSHKRMLPRQIPLEDENVVDARAPVA